VRFGDVGAAAVPVPPSVALTLLALRGDGRGASQATSLILWRFGGGYCLRTVFL
jgi:hypothetical protein